MDPHHHTGLRFGYTARNLTLGLSTGNAIPLSELHDATRVRSVVETNLDALESILRWNADHGIDLFRLSHQVVPFASHPAFPYSWEQEHGPRLGELGTEAARFGIRLSIHPGQRLQPGSPDPEIADRSVAELRSVTRLLSLLGATDLVLHLGGSTDDKGETADRLVHALVREEMILERLALENDERVWTVEDAVPVATRLGIPVIVDTLHHALNPGALSLGEALDAALPTWRRRTKVHLSSQDPAKQAGAHAWDVTPDDLSNLRQALRNRPADAMIEAKGKEKAVLALVR